MHDDLTSASADDHILALSVGTLLLEYEILEVLGHGGFGITYRARDTHLNEIVAIKEYFPNDLAARITPEEVRAKTSEDAVTFSQGLRTFLNEARLTARFDHPNIVKVRRFFELNGTGYLVLNFEPGQALEKVCAHGPLSETRVDALLGPLLDALRLIHTGATLHRDIKPSNIIIRPSGAPVLIDFGAARDFRSRNSHSVTAIGSLGYSPPEQLGVSGRQGPWTDLYALGGVAYRCVTGHQPPDSLRRLRRDPYVPATDVARGFYRPALLQTIDWMLQLDEEERPHSVEVVEKALAGAVVSPKALGPSASRIQSVLRRGPLPYGAVIAAASLALLVYAGLPSRDAAELRIAEEARHQTRMNEDQLRSDERRRSDEAARSAEEQRQQDAERLVQEQRQAEEVARLADEARRRQEAAHIAEEHRQAEEAARLAEQQRQRQEAARLAEERRKAEEAARLAEQQRQREEAARLSEERRKAEEAARFADERRKAEEMARLAEQQRQQEEAARLAEERRKMDEAVARLTEERRKAEEEAARLAAEQRRAEEAASLAGQKRGGNVEGKRQDEAAGQAGPSIDVVRSALAATEGSRLTDEIRSSTPHVASIPEATAPSVKPTIRIAPAPVEGAARCPAKQTLNERGECIRKPVARRPSAPRGDELRQRSEPRAVAVRPGRREPRAEMQTRGARASCFTFAGRSYCE